MNRHARPPIPQHDHYAELRWTALLGGGSETIGPYATSRQRDRAIAAARAPYPGDHQPSARRYAVERPR
jgi:hypothetical protein